MNLFFVPICNPKPQIPYSLPTVMDCHTCPLQITCTTYGMGFPSKIITLLSICNNLLIFFNSGCEMPQIKGQGVNYQTRKVQGPPVQITLFSFDKEISISFFLMKFSNYRQYHQIWSMYNNQLKERDKTESHQPDHICKIAK